MKEEKIENVLHVIWFIVGWFVALYVLGHSKLVDNVNELPVLVFLVKSLPYLLITIMSFYTIVLFIPTKNKDKEK